MGTGRPIHKDPALKKKKLNPLARQISKSYLCHTSEIQAGKSTVQILHPAAEKEERPCLPDHKAQRANGSSLLEQPSDFNYLHECRCTHSVQCVKCYTLSLCLSQAFTQSHTHTHTHSLPLSLVSSWAHKIQSVAGKTFCANIYLCLLYKFAPRIVFSLICHMYYLR